ncbi:ParB/RepB/Spo0J family partition protein [Streptomyces canus]|uniref:ParB/RepB/Spo0J family partition protein n=1 Tax=Streptomyces canus TaxID=58343 RepID=UPI0033DB5408
MAARPASGFDVRAEVTDDHALRRGRAHSSDHPEDQLRHVAQPVNTSAMKRGAAGRGPPLNPRRSFGTDEDKTRFGEELRHAQPAACVAVTRAAYLALWPDHEERIGAAPLVLVNGERRFHGAVHVGLEALDFVVRDDLASSREAFINHLLKENLAREDFDVIERARGVEQLVAACAEATERGARTRAAEQLGKNRSWVTNQLVLLELPAELQTMLSAGTLPERDGRTLARYAKENPGLGAAALLAICKRRRKLRPLAKAEERRQLQKLRAAKGATLLSADNKSEGREPPAANALPDASPAGNTDGSLSADNKPADGTVRGTAKPPAQRRPKQEGPEPATDSAEAVSDEPDSHGQPRQLPYDNAFYVVNHLHLKMSQRSSPKILACGWGSCASSNPDEYSALLRELSEQQQPEGRGRARHTSRRYVSSSAV